MLPPHAPRLYGCPPTSGVPSLPGSLSFAPRGAGLGAELAAPPEPSCPSRCTAWMKSAASCPSSTRRSPTNSTACGCPSSCTRGKRRPHTFGTGPRSDRGPQHPSARAGRDEGRNTPKLRHRRVRCGVPRVPRGRGLTQDLFPQHHPLPGVGDFPDDGAAGPGEAGGLASHLHHLHPQRHHGQPGQCHLPALPCGGEGLAGLGGALNITLIPPQTSPRFWDLAER